MGKAKKKKRRPWNQPLAEQRGGLGVFVNELSECIRRLYNESHQRRWRGMKDRRINNLGY
jgi:hypothetical protein